MTRIICAALAVVLSLFANSLSAYAADYHVAAKADQPVIHFTRLHHRVADVDDHQSLSIFADGRVRVHTPVYMKHAGTYEYRLSSKGLQSLLSTLDGYGLMSRDWGEAKAARDQQAAARNASQNLRFHVSDLTATQITLSFAQFGKQAATGKALEKTIVWHDIPNDARLFSGNEAIQQLAAIEKTLLAMTDHSRRDAVRLTGGQ